MTRELEQLIKDQKASTFFQQDSSTDHITETTNPNIETSNDPFTDTGVLTRAAALKKLQQENEKLKEHIKNTILSSYKTDIENVFSVEKFFDIYDVLESAEAIKLIALKKQRKTTKSVKELKAHLNNQQLIRTFKNTIQMISMQRAFRTKPHILIVEDQAFSHKMLKAALKDYQCHVCERAGEAIVKYMELCPDIVLLDIDLPDLSGHEFAKLINKIDPGSYVVMITANSYPSDIKTAKENNVNGFIVKPFKKNDIDELIENFKKRRK